jgi:hypothetical protein
MQVEVLAADFLPQSIKFPCAAVDRDLIEGHNLSFFFF